MWLNEFSCNPLDSGPLIKVTPIRTVRNVYITKYMDGKRLKETGPDAQKSIIQTYVEKVVVYHDHIDIYMIVDTNGEGGESLTDVQFALQIP